MRGWGGWGGLCAAPSDWAAREDLPEQVMNGGRGGGSPGVRVPGTGHSPFRKRPWEAVAAGVEGRQGGRARGPPYRDRGARIPGLSRFLRVEFPRSHLPTSQASPLPQPQLEGWREGTEAHLNRCWSTLEPPVAAGLACQQWVFNYLNIAFALYFPPGLLSSAKG